MRKQTTQDADSLRKQQTVASDKREYMIDQSTVRHNNTHTHTYIQMLIVKDERPKQKASDPDKGK